MELRDSITEIKGIGDKTKKLFEKLEVRTVADLLEHYPRDYEVYEPIRPILAMQPEQIVTIEATIANHPEMKKARNLSIISCRMHDASGTMIATWFNMPFLKNILRLGNKFILRGKVIRKNGELVMEQPKILSKQEYTNLLNSLQPIYPLTAGLTNHLISKTVTAAIKNTNLSGDYLPKAIRDQYQLLDYKKALSQIHFPKNKEEAVQARRRLIFDEFFFFMLGISLLKEQKNIQKSNHIFTAKDSCEELINQLPYQLTNAQVKVWNEIQEDLASEKVMNRLVQGDVGSGKTILAALALLKTAQNGHQGALMVPTEVLARQHYESLCEVFEPYGIKPILLVGSMTAKEKRQAYEKIKEHEVDVVIGTHALIQEKVEYDSLALVITDEQHRFGVRQRETLSDKGNKPHILVMSATPIPRTLAIIMYGDLDISIIDELPSNRLPIKNCVVNTNYRKTAYSFIEKEVLSGHQAYVICPMVEESETMDGENVIDYAGVLQDVLPSEVTVEYLHGKMKTAQKNEIMERFASGITKVLVSTTVVEVGVNVPNATVMMIENAERFGLAQLHQLRGRVGRGGAQSYCILINGNESKDSKERLEILCNSNDGFYIASEDLKLRGPGDLFGIRQSGDLEFKLADVFTDSVILKAANEAANTWGRGQLKQLCEKSERIRQKIAVYTSDALL